MSRKDYEAIANVFATEHKSIPKFLGPGVKTWEYAFWERMRSNIADILGDDNPRFDRSKFYAACEGVTK